MIAGLCGVAIFAAVGRDGQASGKNRHQDGG